jgi:hypothetical protein
VGNGKGAPEIAGKKELFKSALAYSVWWGQPLLLDTHFGSNITAVSYTNQDSKRTIEREMDFFLRDVTDDCA